MAGTVPAEADGSVFLDDEELWTRENIRELKEAGQPPTHGRTDTSWSLLKQQLQDKRPGILRLAAEAVWLTDLYPTKPGEAPSWKRTRFEELWRSSSSQPPESRHLSDRALRGVGNVSGQHWVASAYRLQVSPGKPSNSWKEGPAGVGLRSPMIPGSSSTGWMTRRCRKIHGSPDATLQLLYLLLYPDVIWNPSDSVGRQATRSHVAQAPTVRAESPTSPRSFDKSDQAVYEIRKVHREGSTGGSTFDDPHIRATVEHLNQKCLTRELGDAP